MGSRIVFAAGVFAAPLLTPLMWAKDVAAEGMLSDGDSECHVHGAVFQVCALLGVSMGGAIKCHPLMPDDWHGTANHARQVCLANSPNPGIAWPGYVERYDHTATGYVWPWASENVISISWGQRFEAPAADSWNGGTVPQYVCESDSQGGESGPCLPVRKEAYGEIYFSGWYWTPDEGNTTNCQSGPGAADSVAFKGLTLFEATFAGLTSDPEAKTKICSMVANQNVPRAALLPEP
jgi:hypothetical protein